MIEAKWLTVAKAEIGQQEIAGSQHNPRILEYHAETTLNAKDDETAWCASFVGWCLRQAGLVGTRLAAARSYLTWGDALADPVPGAIAVLWRGSRDGWQGHVGFYVGEDPAGQMLLLGGNQANKVSVAPYSHDRLLNFRWPTGVPLPRPGYVARPEPAIVDLALEIAAACNRFIEANKGDGS